MAVKMTKVINELPGLRKAAEQVRDILLANVVMMGEIPAPTFKEENRIRFLHDRFSESGLQDCSVDEVGNGFGVLPGEEGGDHVLLIAHADTIFDEKVDHTVSIQSEWITGPGVGDNSLGMAVLATLPMLMKQVDFKPRSNMILMGASRSLGRGDLEGLRFFLENNRLPIRCAVCMEGVQLGRLSYSSLGMLRGEIHVRVPEMYDWTRLGAAGAIVMLNDVINRINQIRLPKRPKTSIVLGSIRGGTSFNTIATNSVLRFEIRSESADVVRSIHEQIEDAISEISSETNADVKLDILARRKPGGIGFRHPMVRCAREIMRAMDVEPRIAPSTSELSALIDHKIPAITLGISTGDQLNQLNERVRITPMFSGVAQLMGILKAVDGGLCDED